MIVATLAMEVAAKAGEASSWDATRSWSAYSHMSGATALDVKRWMLHTAQHDKITAIAPESIVPVSFVVRTLVSIP